MKRIQLHTELRNRGMTRAYVASCGDYEVATSSGSPIPGICRKMMEDMNGLEVVEVYRGEQKVFGPATLKYWARKDVVENDDGIHTKKHVPFPSGTSKIAQAKDPDSPTYLGG